LLHRNTVYRHSISFNPGQQHLFEPLDLPITSDNHRHDLVLKELELSFTHRHKKKLMKEIFQKKCGMCFGASLEVCTGGFLVRLRGLHISPPDGAIDDSASLASICLAFQKYLCGVAGARGGGTFCPSTPEVSAWLTLVDNPNPSTSGS